MKVCPSCDAVNGDAAGFCERCGEFLDWDRPADVVVADRRTSRTPATEPPVETTEVVTTEVETTEVETTKVETTKVVTTEVVISPQPDDGSAETQPTAVAAAEVTASPAPNDDVVDAAEVELETDRQRLADAERERAAAARAELETERQRLADAERANEARRAEQLRKLVAGNAPASPAPSAEAAPVPPAMPADRQTARREPARPRGLRPAPASIRTRAGTEPGSLASVITIAERGGRTDLSSRLKATRDGLDRTTIAVAVVGEYKKGKSNLVNALVNADVCPSDPVFATVVPIVVRHADEMTAMTELLDGTSRPLSGLDHLAELASETGNLDNHLHIARVEVGLPRRLLATGLTFVDTPGVGGLDSAIGSLVLARLSSADGVLFATDCSQELTAPELTYLSVVRERCDAVVCVMTKRDLYIQTPALVAKNRQHLDAHGLNDVPIVAVSSVLHLLALADTNVALEAESGFEELFDAIHRRIWEPARARGVVAAGLEMASVAAHLAMPLEAEREAASSPEAAARTIDRLSEWQDRVRQLRTASARWQQRLNEGTQDVLNDLDHDLQQRMRALTRTAEGRADTDAGNPSEDLVFEVWLHKATMDTVIEFYTSITDRMTALADEITELFVSFDREMGFRVEAETPTDRIAAIHVVRETSPLKDSPLRRVITTTQGYSSGIVLVSSLFALANPVAWLPLLTVPIAGFMARRAFSDDRTRRRTMRTQELKRLATRYVDEIRFVVQKDARDTIRRLRREIQEHYIERTEELDRTLQQALAAAQQARDGQTAHPGDSAEATIRQMRTTADRLVATGAKAS